MAPAGPVKEKLKIVRKVVKGTTNRSRYAVWKVELASIFAALANAIFLCEKSLNIRVLPQGNWLCIKQDTA